MSTTDTASDTASDMASDTTSYTSSLATTATPAMTTTATGTSLLALTTPFVQTGSCTDLYSTTYITNRFYSASSVTTLTLYVSDTANPAFTSCQPSGWANVAPERRFSFSPAVCPSDWTAYDIAPIGTGIKNVNATATAFCCTRDHTPALLVDIYTGPHGDLAACHTDITTLTPRPPDITCDATIRTWVPGSTIPPLPCYEPEHNLTPPGLMPFLMIGLPLILSLALFSCCGYCAFKVRQDKAKEARAARRAQQAEEDRQAVDLRGFAHWQG